MTPPPDLPLGLLVVARAYHVSPQEVALRWPLRLTIWALEALEIERDLEAALQAQEERTRGH